MECYELDANLDIQRRFTWKEIMHSGSSESYAVDKYTLGTYGEILTNAIALTTQEI